jgi:hypothetical protein
MYSRFDTEARIAVAQATDIARELGHSQVGPDHLLLGLLANMRGTAYAALADHGLRLDAVRDFVVTHHTEPVTAPEDAETRPSDEADRLAEDREALRAIGIDLDKVKQAVRDNLGADLTEGWGSRPGRDRRSRAGRSGRGRRHHDDHHGDHHGRGRRGPRSRRDEGLRFSPGLRDLMRDVRRAAARDGMTGQLLALALLESDDAVVRGVLATATDLDGLRIRLQTVGAESPTA